MLSPATRVGTVVEYNVAIRAKMDGNKASGFIHPPTEKFEESRGPLFGNIDLFVFIDTAGEKKASEDHRQDQEQNC